MSSNFHNEFNQLEPSIQIKTPDQYIKLDDTKLIPRDLDSFPEELKNAGLEKFKIITFIDKKISGGWTPKKIAPILDEYFKNEIKDKPSSRTIIRWRKTYNDSGGNINSLVEKRHLMGNRKQKVFGDEVFFEQALARFLDSKRPTVTAAYQYYKDSIIIENESIVDNKIHIISYNSFLKRINNLPPYPVAVARHGKHVADQWFKFGSSHIPPTRVLQRVEIDHTPLDLILLDDELLIPLGRPNLTLLLDVYSSCVAGFHLSYKSPSYVSAAKAISHAIKPKNLGKLGIKLQNEYSCSGKMETLVVDNGAEFWSESLNQACIEAKINVQYNPVKRPWLKPFVERFFGMINQYFLAEIPGKTFSNIMEKEDYKPERDAIMRFSTFVDEFHRWIVDIYHQDSDSRMTKIPSKLWDKSVEELPPLDLSEEESSFLDVVMFLKFERTIGKNGFKFEELMYDSTALSDYRKRYPQTPNSLKKMIKVDPDDLSRIYVYLEELESYIEVPCTDTTGYTKNLSLHEHKTIKKYNREFIQESMDPIGLAKARMAMHKRIEDEQRHFIEQTSKRKIKNVSKQAKIADVSNTGKGTIKRSSSKQNDALPASNKPSVLDSWDDDLHYLEAFE